MRTGGGYQCTTSADCPWGVVCRDKKCKPECELVKGIETGTGCPAGKTCTPVTDQRVKCYTTFADSWICKGGNGYKVRACGAVKKSKQSKTDFSAFGTQQGLCLQECDVNKWPSLSDDCDLKPDRAGLYTRCCTDAKG